MTGDDEKYWYNLKTGQVERGFESPSPDRAGPFDTPEDAADRAEDHGVDPAVLRGRLLDDRGLAVAGPVQVASALVVLLDGRPRVVVPVELGGPGHVEQVEDHQRLEAVPQAEPVVG